MLAAGDRGRLQLLDVGAMARRPRGADPPRLTPSSEPILPAHADEGRLRVRTVAPKLGQHNAEIFGRLGVTEAEMQGLRTKHLL